MIMSKVMVVGIVLIGFIMSGSLRHSYAEEISDGPCYNVVLCPTTTFLDMKEVSESQQFVSNLTIYTAPSRYNIGISYAVAENDEDNTYFKARTTITPSNISLMTGEIITIRLENSKNMTDIEQVRSVSLYRSNVSDSSIILGTAGTNDVVDLSKIDEDKFQVPDSKFALKDYSKLVIDIEGNDEFEEFYIAPNVIIIEGT